MSQTSRRRRDRGIAATTRSGSTEDVWCGRFRFTSRVIPMPILPAALDGLSTISSAISGFRSRHRLDLTVDARRSRAEVTEQRRTQPPFHAAPAIPVPAELLAHPLEFGLMTREGLFAEDEQELLSPRQSGPFQQPVNHFRHAGHKWLSLKIVLGVVEYPRRPIPIRFDRSQNVACAWYQSVPSGPSSPRIMLFDADRFFTRSADFANAPGHYDRCLRSKIT